MNRFKSGLISQIVLAAWLLQIFSASASADENVVRALKRASYLLNARVPTDSDYASDAASVGSYRDAVRRMITDDQFYHAMMRYHERIFGTGLKDDYLEELLREDIDNKQNKFARVICQRDTSNGQSRFRCDWVSASQKNSTSGCPQSTEQAVSVFWYPGIVAWVCPTVVTTCGPDLSRCFIQYSDADEAKNSEYGTTESFDSRFAVIQSLSRQAAGLATALVLENYPYTHVLSPGITAVDGAIAHFYRQSHHFRIEGLHVPSDLLQTLENISFTDTRFRLVNTGSSYESAGVLSTFGWLRRYDKNRTRANQVYERLLCRKFTSELPRVFPQDPGNLRETPGCSGCHATLDPLADFFKVWGEGGEFYSGQNAAEETYFNNQTGSYLADLANIIKTDRAFAACQVQHVWSWLMGRSFYHQESALRDALTDYFISTDYSMRELVYAVATHPVFMSGQRSDGVVTDPLEEPPLGTQAGDTERECTTTIDYAADIAPSIGLCTSCHSSSSGNRQDLSTESQWQQWGSQAVNMMASGSMPPGQFGPEIQEFKEKVRCWKEQNP
jgi:hypothetical protein